MVDPAVQKDVQGLMVYAHQQIAEEVILKLHCTPCPNKKKTRGGKYIPSLTEAELVTEFWKE